MLSLKTGVPGSGKTLSAVKELYDALRKSPDRVVFVHGVKDLVLPHRKLPVRVLQGGQKIERREVVLADGTVDLLSVVVEEEDPGSVYEVDWSQVPDGALILIDEAQRVFPMRGAGQKVPAHVSFLNTHRHRGIDIWVITQHPKLIDNAVRRLVGKHQHYRRMFGGQRAVVYEWDQCSDGLQFSSATKGAFLYPKSVYALYKSAEVHNKQKFSYPVWLAIPLIAIPAGIFFVPKAIEVLHGTSNGKPLTPGQTAGPKSGSAGASAPGLAVADSSHVAKPQATRREGWIDAPDIQGCMAVGDKCSCIGKEGRPVKIALSMCKISASSFDGLVQWAPREEQPAPKVPPTSPAPLPAAASAPQLFAVN